MYAQSYYQGPTASMPAAQTDAPRYHRGPNRDLGPYNQLQPGNFPSYKDSNDTWHLQHSPQLLGILSRVCAALRLSWPHPQFSLLRHYFFVVAGRPVTPNDLMSPQRIHQWYHQTWEFFHQRFPQIWLHDNMSEMLRRNDRSTSHSSTGEFLLGAHDRGTHNNTIFLDKATILALESSQNVNTTRCLTILIVSTLFHELAHCFWTDVHGEDSFTLRTSIGMPPHPLLSHRPLSTTQMLRLKTSILLTWWANQVSLSKVR
ncbi:hypothetical protein DFH06DRAFT_695189 [Mycena polygramma]|nr:hypothetical protein DFH06DRAFT_695189 [Mycena polygramma]